MNTWHKFIAICKPSKKKQINLLLQFLGNAIISQRQVTDAELADFAESCIQEYYNNRL